MNRSGLAMYRVFKHTRVLIGGLVLAVVMALPANAQFKNEGAMLGTNVFSIVDYTSVTMFTDLFREARVWIPQREGVWDTGETLNLRPQDEYPATLAPDQWASALMKRGTSGHYPGGQYTVFYEGDGVLGFQFDATVIHSEPGKMLLNVVPTSNGILATIFETNPANPIRNIRVVLPGFENTYQTQIFHPQFFEVLQPFSVLRFMDTQRTTHSIVTGWHDRTTLNHYTQAREQGPALELMIDLSNQAGTDPWFCIPDQADNDYVIQFATMVRDRLDPDLRAYIEYSNEIWNGGFKQAARVESIGVSKWPEVSPFEARMRQQSARSVEIFDLFESVLGGTDRIVRVMAAQHANSGTSTMLLDWNNAYLKTDALATAPYWGYELGNSSAGHNTPNQSVNYVIDFCAQDIETQRNATRNNKLIADARGVRLISYEGGQHLVGVGSYLSNSQVTSLFTTANRDPRMRALYNQYLDGWQQDAGDLFVNYNLWGSNYSLWGSWPVIEFFDQPLSNFPKYMGLKDYADRVTSGPQILQFSAAPSPIAEGGSSTLTWQTADAASVSINSGIGAVAASGSITITPAATTTYTLTATNAEGTKTSSTTVTVQGTLAPNVITFSASPSNVTEGGSTTLSWSTENTDQVTITPSVGTFNTETGNALVSPTSTTVYTLTATGAGGQDVATTTVTVNAVGAPTITTFTATPGTINAGESTTLNWATNGADSVSITPNIGTVSASGSITLSPIATTAYTLVATNAAGLVADAANVIVIQPNGPVIGSFTASPSSIVQGNSATLTWNTTNATSVSISPNVGAVALDGNVSVSPVVDTAYTLVALNSGGEASASATITVSAVVTAPAIVSHPNDVTIGIGNTASFTVSADGTGPLNFQWQRNGANIANANVASYVTPPVTSVDNGAQYRVVVSNSAGTVVSQAAVLTVATDAQRSTNGLQALYLFDELSGNIVHDRSGVGQPLDLVVENTAAVTWSDEKLSINSSTIVASTSAANKLNSTLMQTGSVTVEAWVRPANLTQDGPARIATISSGTSERNVTLGQKVNGIESRLRTTQTDTNGVPETFSGYGMLSGSVQHVVFTRSASGVNRILVNGVQVSASQVGGTFGNWNAAYRFGLANEFSNSRPWMGDYHLVAVYNRALTDSEVQLNFAAGPDPQSNNTDPIIDPSGNTVVSIPVAKDVTLFEDSWGTIASGSGAYLYSGNAPSDKLRRALMQFDVANSVPAGATIVNAKLQFNVSYHRRETGTQALRLQKSATNWGEGPSDSKDFAHGTKAKKGDSTWVYTYYRQEKWDTKGGDMIGGIVASVNVPGTGVFEWNSDGLALDVQTWLDGTLPNYGWFILGNETQTDTVKRIDSLQHPEPAKRPVLIVEYTMSAASAAEDGSGTTRTDDGSDASGTTDTTTTTDGGSTSTGSTGTDATTGTTVDGTVVLDPAATTYESSVPSVDNGGGAYLALLDSVLAVRLRDAAGIDVNSLTAQLDGHAENAYTVSWQSANGSGDQDIWLVVEPAGLWPEGQVVSVVVNGNNRNGQPVTEATAAFLIQADFSHAVDKLSQADAALTIEPASNVPTFSNAVGVAHTIQPEQVFAQSRRVLLPVPKGVDANSLDVHYYKPSGDDSGWYVGTNVDGWMTQDAPRIVREKNRKYVEIFVNHAGIVQLGVK